MEKLKKIAKSLDVFVIVVLWFIIILSVILVVSTIV